MSKDSIMQKWTSICKCKKKHNNQLGLSWCGCKKEKKNWFNLLFVFTWYLRPNLWKYENMSKLLQFLDVKDFPKTHWSNSIGWEMTSYMHELVVKKTRDLVQVARFISFSYDEVTTLDQQFWVSIHAYMIENWLHIHFVVILTMSGWWGHFK